MFLGGVLVAQGCFLGGVAEAAHDLLGAGSGRSGECPGDVAQVVQVQVGEIK